MSQDVEKALKGLRTLNRGCKGCRYKDQYYICNYSLITGQRRPCKPWPGGGCDAKDTRKNRDPHCHPPNLMSKRQTRQIAATNRTYKSRLEDNQLAAELYDKGANDLQIALACGCRRETVMKWRHTTGRESNWKKTRKEPIP